MFLPTFPLNKGVRLLQEFLSVDEAAAKKRKTRHCRRRGEVLQREWERNEGKTRKRKERKTTRKQDEDNKKTVTQRTMKEGRRRRKKCGKTFK